jgi:hypothetical protein
MTPNQEAVAGAIAVLLSTTPEDHLGKLLKVCLAAKVEGDVTAKSKELFGRTEELAYWLHEVIPIYNHLLKTVYFPGMVCYFY